MSVNTASARSHGLPLPPRPRPRARDIAVRIVLVGLFGISLWSLAALEFSIADVIAGAQNAVDFTARMFPLDFPPIAETAALIIESLSVVAAATVLAVVLSIPLAILAAHNTAPNRTSSSIARGFITIMRAIPDLVLAIFFFRLFGLGALPGVLAMGLHSIGMVGKLYADAIEDLDNGPLEALRAAGASRSQQILSGVIPQLTPQIVATALHRFDINLRHSVLLGYVGVGGIGMALADALNTMNYKRGMALALIVLVLCMIVELISGSVRMILLGRNEPQRGFMGLLRRLSEGWIDRPTATHQVQRDSSGRVKVAPPWDAARISRTMGIVLTLLLVLSAFMATKISPALLFTGFADLPATLVLFWPPDGGSIKDTLFAAMLTTVHIGFAATLIGVVLALPIGSLAARNVAPNRTVALFFRALIVIVRAFPELILAIILIVMMGLGPVPGAIALGIGSVGLLGKLVADSIEETDVRVQEAVRANGASRLQVYASTTLRQITPALVGHILYQLDNNIRAATLLGLVGAGGIGFYLLEANRVLEFQTVTYIVGLILITVLALEMLAVWIRKTVR